jgi:hypothetical protein
MNRKVKENEMNRLANALVIGVVVCIFLDWQKARRDIAYAEGYMECLTVALNTFSGKKEATKES